MLIISDFNIQLTTRRQGEHRLKRLILALLVLIAIIPTHLLCQM